MNQSIEPKPDSSVAHTSSAADGADVAATTENNTPLDPSAEKRVEQTPTDGDNESSRPVEIGGQKGPEPTRYGDWEKKGRCTDF